ncbi:C40 family peptidase [Neptuniibacter pectenicola]|jgi:lipoprotein Spr/probable lipoprotein NlpC|uniref:C40 family peptidase n=1 Tax=Neptuniibacter pectenicola TaxID=1806669 RepID=UPI000836B3D3|nr:NlpC/P60 family protein [Neptuniibacter pectenicola]
MNLRSINVLLFFILILQGCSSYSTRPSTASINIQPQSPVAHALLDQHKNWQGTPYQWGGESRQGVDCSAFTQLTYQTVFGYQLPRTTIAQVDSGVAIKQHQLTPGDLVFFKLGGNKQRHVGVYVEQGVFLHASTSKGVTLSRLDNPYWKQHYWKAVRPKK